MDKQINICDELSQNFIDFSYEANSCRAFADARDGLKPGQRACLWEMYHKGFLSSKPCVKSAKIAGGVTGAWWPHGDVAIYDTFTRMSQSWINNIPEVSWHGNNGSQIVPDSAAAPRYTEARLSRIVEEGMFRGIKKNSVNMIPNYSEDEEWPEVLPAIFPRLLVNGCQGIGSTIANVWLPNNFAEVSNVLLKYIKTGEVDYSNLYPDFPVHCQIINKNDVKSIYETGKGKVILRARAEIDNKHIHFYELPYQVYVEPIIDKIKELVTNNEIEGIESVYNKSSKKGIEIDIECSGNPEAVLKLLYAKTDLQKSYNANQWALVGKTPKLLTLRDYCQIYVKHNLECIVRETKFDKDKAEARLEIVNGLLKALEDIDNIIALIKKSENAAAAKETLIKKYNLSEVQAKAILDMKLSRLAHLEKIELEEEKTNLEKTLKELIALINSEDLQKIELSKRLIELVNKFGDARRTELAQIEIPKEEKEIVAVIPEDVVVITTQTGLIKRVPATAFKVQKKGGRGVKSQDEAVLDVVKTNTVDTMMFFSNKGKMYRMIVDDLPAGTNTTKGTSLSTLLPLEATEKIIAVTSLHRTTTPKYVIFITQNGMIKKSYLEEYMKLKKNRGIVALNLKEGDSLVDIIFQDDEDIIIVTEKGMGIRFSTKEIAPIGRTTMGVKAIKLNEEDKVVAGLPVHKETDFLGLVTTTGLGKKIALNELPCQARGGKGLIILKSEDALIAGAVMVDDNDNILIVGNYSSICVSVKDLPLLGRIAIGNIMIKNNKVLSITKI